MSRTLETDIATNTLVVWDVDEEPPLNALKTLLWRSFDENTDQISIPRRVEDEAESLRARYLAWIFELGETRIDGKRMVDHLELRPGLSYWWMGSMAQKFNASSASQIENAIKAFVLEDIVAQQKPGCILLVSANDELASTLRVYCQNIEVGFRWDRNEVATKPLPLSQWLSKKIPSPLKALIYLLWFLARSMPLLISKKYPLSSFDGEVSFVDILTHLNKQSFVTGKFASNYWTLLTERLLQSGIRSNWLHNHFRQEPVASFSLARKLCGRFTRNSESMQRHALIEEYLTLSTFLNAVKDYFRLYCSCGRLSKDKRGFTPNGSALDFWPLFKDGWVESLRGHEAFLNCLRVGLYEKVFRALPSQKLGVYLHENQPWELALIHAWKSAGHGRLVAVPHTTVRYWDLRYYFDRRSLQCIGRNDLPMPDQVAVNGPIAKLAFVEGGYPQDRIVEVEALRFLYLSESASWKIGVNTSAINLTVLVCGDFLSKINQKMLSWLETAARSLPSDTKFLFKPHPAYPVRSGDFPSLELEITDSPIQEAMIDCDAVFTSNTTSAAVDAYCSGLPVIQILDGDGLNMSPLRGLSGVTYVSDAAQLAVALSGCQISEYDKIESYFHLDEHLPRWQDLLGLDCGG